MRYRNQESAPMVDEGVIALVAITVIAKGQANQEDKALAERMLKLAVKHLEANEAEIAAEVERRKVTVTVRRAEDSDVF